MPRSRPKPKAITRISSRRKVSVKRPVPIHQRSLTKRLHHAEQILSKMGLSGNSLRDCSKALAELEGQKVQLAAVMKIVGNFPHSVKTNKPGSPVLRSNFERAMARVEQERHYVNTREWKIVLEFEKAYPGKGEVLAKKAILAYENSFRPKN